MGVFVNAPFEVMDEIALNVDLNLLQLHGDESPSAIRKCANYWPVLRAFRVHRGFRPSLLATYKHALAFLLDGFSPHSRGGTGRTFDWRKAVAAKQYGPVVLAGGLTSDNIVEAIVSVQPAAIDVCSGVESRPGKKDPARLRALMRQVETVRRKLV